MALVSIMKDIKVSSSPDRWMVKILLWKTIGLEMLRICLDCWNVNCGAGVAASGCTLGIIVLPFEWSFTLGTIVGSFDWTLLLGTLAGVGFLVGG